jgi:hypothetical protein
MNTPFLDNVRYVGIIFDKKIIPKIHVEKTIAEALGTYLYIRTYSLLKNDRLNANIKIAFHKALIRSVMTCACPTWESAADAHLLKLQHLQKRVLCATGNFDRHTVDHNLLQIFKIPCVYDYISKLEEAGRSHQNPNVHENTQGRAIHRKITVIILLCSIRVVATSLLSGMEQIT